MRAMGFVQYAQRRHWGDQWSDHTLADHMESLMYYLGEVVNSGVDDSRYYLGEVVNSGVDDSRFLAMELLFFLSCFIYCMEYYNQHVVASYLQASVTTISAVRGNANA